MCLPAMIQAKFRKYIINDIKSRQNLGSRQGWKISDDVQIQLSFAQANVDQKYFKVYSQLRQFTMAKMTLKKGSHKFEIK